MKKLLILIFIIFLSSCSIFQKENSPNTEVLPKLENNLDNTWSTTLSDSWSVMDLVVPSDYKLPDGDLNLFFKMVENDKNFFAKNKDELEFFNIWRDYLYNEKNTDGKLVSCLNQTIDSTSLVWFDAEICKWENKFVAGSGKNWAGLYNAYHIKDSLLKFKSLKEWKKFDCKYFIDTDYDYPKENKLTIKINDYFACKKFQDNTYPLLKNNYIFLTITWGDMKEKKNLCSELDDENLIKLCNEKIKEYSENNEK